MTKSFKKKVFPIEDIEPGMVVAEDIWNRQHTQVMVGKGTELDLASIDALDRWEIYDVPIRVEVEKGPREKVALPDQPEPTPKGKTNGTAPKGGTAIRQTGLDTGPAARQSLWQRGDFVNDGSVLLWSPGPVRRQTIGRALMPLKVEVLQATTQEEALTHLTQRLPFVLLLDMDKVDTTSLESISVLQEVQTQHIPIIIISEADARAAVLAAKKYGVRGYVKWPFDPETLRAKVDQFKGTPALP